MTDLRDLICRAETLQAKGFTRRAASAWRNVALHPEAPEKVRARLWEALENGNANSIDATGLHARDRASRRTRRDVVLKMHAAGANSAQIAERLNMARSTVNKAISRANKAAQAAQEAQEAGKVH
ncbi:helix-turn-helix domain-containing protein [Citrobacter portucalensis]|uniref:helix-turn-helix domain-containing protein n=1 Tax=Citrobacter portucalensis TaxID=1639133 RepID=UPI00226B5F75|nr:helix-turn-helix domain-containing protein [Citrobacter portucalensis]MCX8985152.1 helix-turn-helix domain-containing protein [Citrobacter portucalensis]